MPRSRVLLPLCLVLSIYLPLVLWYSLVTPIFEAPDESSHYMVAHFMATTGNLPVLDEGSPGEEDHQPPLYYALLVPALRLLDPGDPSAFMERNPHAAISAVSSYGNKNAFLHGNEAERWPPAGVALAVHMARLVSMTLGTLTVLATYGIAWHVFTESRRWLATASAAVVAFTPQFIFVSGAVNNDSAVAALCALTLWLVIAYAERPASFRWLLALGVVGGLAMLSKQSGLVSIAFVVGGLALKALHRRQFSQFWKEVVVVVSVSALVGGWWYLRNLVLYGDPLLRGYISRWYGANAIPFDPVQLVQRFWQGLPSYWGVFGWLNIGWPDWVYLVLKLATLAAGFGLGVRVLALVRSEAKNVNRLALVMVCLWVLLVLAAVSQWVMIAGGLQGRLLFPAIGALSVLCVLGWTGLVPTRWQRHAAAVPVVGLLGLALATPVLFIAPAYAPPRIVSMQEARQSMIPTSLRFNDQAELLGYRTEPQSGQPGETLKVVLYWQALSQVEADFSVFVKLFGRGHEEIGAINTYPGLGSLPTSQWPIGEIIEDVYPIRIAEGALAPVLADLRVGWYDTHGRHAVQQVDPQGNSTDLVGELKVVPAQWPPIPPVTIAGFGDQIYLADYEWVQSDESMLTLLLTWVAQSAPDSDLTVFAHLVDDQGEILAQTDQPPLAGDYPTSHWQPGEVIADQLNITIPEDWSQVKALMLGWYDPVTGERLTASDASGRVVGDAVALDVRHGAGQQ